VAELKMEKDTKQKIFTAQNIRKRFDDTLGQHMDYLVGTRYGVGALPLNLATISSIILLNEREKEINSFSDTSSERYTYETLLNELTEIGLDPDEDLKMNLQDMIQKAYIDVDESGRFSAQKPTTSMAQVLDRVFPKMPGMNFIAYFVQTIDEAQSGRKELSSAISQLDQTLQMQEVSILKQKTKTKKGQALRQSFKRLAKLKETETPHISASGSKIISSNGNLGQVEIRELFAGQDEAPEKPEEMDKVVNAQETEIFEEVKEEGPETGSDKQDLIKETVSIETSFEDIPPAHEDSIHVSEPVEKETVLSAKPKIEVSKTKAFEVDDALLQSETKYETEIVTEGHSLTRADDGIEKQIVTFEEDLAMQCPLCKIAKVQAKETATGKTYYKCSNKDCNFISWGKPYHIVCPQCQNPFLVETLNRDGKPILKCPRATCRYWQKLPGEITEEHREKDLSTGHRPDALTEISRKPRRRVVKRRVVRRKR
jgi:ssDNA-binding Zn-finger/Zn-ribbon topoisomerase 1